MALKYNIIFFTIFPLFCLFIYGIFNVFIEVEENACRMTYMFQNPQYLRINFKGNEKFPNYGLYYYYEGAKHYDIGDFPLNGAPVIFIPGNAGSYKQSRSLASVALRKGMDNDRNIRLDFFTIDYNEEFSALYGGYLEHQKIFLKLSIKTILQLYKSRHAYIKKVVLIGHSMGGVLAKAVLTDEEIVGNINSVIFISSPLDRPVVNFDDEIQQFYVKTDAELRKKRFSFISDKTFNSCCRSSLAAVNSSEVSKDDSALHNVILVSIGGGNRDLLVPAALTKSIYNDVHAMTSAIPNVWLSCDHLASVWCLQLMLTINRFLFNIAHKNKNHHTEFIDDRKLRLQWAQNYFIRHKNRIVASTDAQFEPRSNAVWEVVTQRVFQKHFSKGIRNSHYFMLPLAKFKDFKKLYINAIDVEDNNWLYGCVAKFDENNAPSCDKGTSLAHNIESIPLPGQESAYALLDINNLIKTYRDWTHIVIKLKPTSKAVSLNVDIHMTEQRSLNIKKPNLFALTRRTLINETIQGTAYYKLLIEDLKDSFVSLKLNVEPVACLKKSFKSTIRLCTPWLQGFERYKVLTETNPSFYINADSSTPKGYNTTENPLVLEMFLDPNCRYSLSLQSSIDVTMSRIVLQISYWLPAHMTAVLIIVLKNQLLSLNGANGALNTLKPYVGFFQCTSLYLISGCKLLSKLLRKVPFVRELDEYNHQIYAVLIIHSTAIILSIILSFTLWFCLTIYGSFFHKVALRLTGFSVAGVSLVQSVFTYMPISLGVLMISLAFGTCSGIALLLTLCFYFLVLSNAYKDAIENHVMEKITAVLKRKLQRSKQTAGTSTASSTVATTTATTATADDNDLQIQSEVQESEDEIEQPKGFQNFPLHITCFLLFFIQTLLSVPATVSWTKNYIISKEVLLPDPSLWPALVSILALSLHWQLKTPYKIRTNTVISFFFYVCAAMCVLFCQEEVYQLSYIIAFLYISLLILELIYRIIG